MGRPLQAYLTTRWTEKVEEGIFTTLEKELAWALDAASRCTGGPVQEAYEKWAEENPKSRAGLRGSS